MKPAAEKNLTIILGATAVNIRCTADLVDVAYQVSDRLAELKVERYLHTKLLRVSSSEPSHSHPILTIHSSHVGSEFLPAVFIHEEMHWSLSRCQPSARATLLALCRAFPSSGLDMTHVAVCRLELLSLSDILGLEPALRLVCMAARYRREYNLALEKGEEIDACMVNISRWVHVYRGD